MGPPYRFLRISREIKNPNLKRKRLTSLFEVSLENHILTRVFVMYYLALMIWAEVVGSIVKVIQWWRSRVLIGPPFDLLTRFRTNRAAVVFFAFRRIGHFGDAYLEGEDGFVRD